METKFTPGPWKVRIPHAINPGIPICMEIETDERAIASAWSAGHVDLRIQEANAMLIAAAPEMYEALVAIDRWIKNNNVNPLCEDQITSAIKKARGEVS